MTLHQIFKKLSEDPQVRGRAYHDCNLSKISKRFLFKIFRRSQLDFLKDLLNTVYWDVSGDLFPFFDPRILLKINFIKIS